MQRDVAEPCANAARLARETHCGLFAAADPAAPHPGAQLWIEGALLCGLCAGWTGHHLPRPETETELFLATSNDEANPRPRRRWGRRVQRLVGQALRT